jgi:hypothetical protein
MKTAIPGLPALAGSTNAHAEAIAFAPERARAAWKATTPEQQAAARTMVKTQAQEKQAAWGASSDEEMAPGQGAAREKFKAYRGSLRSDMQNAHGQRPSGRR